MLRVLILGQPSQVDFPSDYKNASPEPEREADQTSLLRAYQVTAETVRNVANGLRVIITEHADLQAERFSSGSRLALSTRSKSSGAARVGHHRAIASRPDGKDAAEGLAGQDVQRGGARARSSCSASRWPGGEAARPSRSVSAWTGPTRLDPLAARS